MGDRVFDGDWRTDLVSWHAPIADSRTEEAISVAGELTSPLATGRITFIVEELSRIIWCRIDTWLDRWDVNLEEDRWILIAIMSHEGEHSVLPQMGRIREFAIVEVPIQKTFGSRLCVRWTIDGGTLKFESWERIPHESP